MKNNIIVAIAMLALVVTGCKEDSTTASQGEAVISGRVNDGATAGPLAGVTVQAQSVSGISATDVTDAEGNYELRFELDSTATVTLLVGQKSGFRDTTIVVQIQSGQALPISLSLSRLSPVSGGTGSGVAQTIAFLGANPREVSVFGVGGQETAILGWEVRDSLGLPIDVAHSVALAFAIQGSLGGNEYISPVTANTNASGQAFITFNAGFRSGVVQIVATATIAGRPPIVSSPVRLIIRAGFADQAHFTLAAERFNFPALNRFGFSDGVSVLVGDVYSNPVAENTAVYFNSVAGVIQPSVFTDVNGQGGVSLFSGNPQPYGIYAVQAPGLGDGYHYLVARTIGQGGVSVRDTILLLWSGASLVDSLLPNTFNIPNTGFQDFTFKVCDGLGHPLSAGTTISVVATVPPPPSPDFPVNQVQLGFGVQGRITLEDVIFPGPGTTNFSFRLSDGSTQIDTLTAVSVSINVTSQGQNGNAYTSINGTVH